jgi:hypothetical protein
MIQHVGRTTVEGENEDIMSKHHNREEEAEKAETDPNKGDAEREHMKLSNKIRWEALLTRTFVSRQVVRRMIVISMRKLTYVNS